jgi:hypothetical protein
MGWDLDYANNGRSFYENTLKTDYVNDDSLTTRVAAVAGKIFAGISDFDFDVKEGAPYDADYPDTINPLTDASACLTYVGGLGGNAGLQVDTGTYKIVHFGFPFECITSETSRREIMQDILEYFNVIVPVELSTFAVE